MIQSRRIQSTLNLNEKFPIVREDNNLPSGVCMHQIAQPVTVVADIVVVETGNRIIKDNQLLSTPLIPQDSFRASIAAV